jgi:hypothetical protein
MFICPVCKKQYEKDQDVAKCFLKCWKEQNPVHKSKNAPKSEDKIERQCEESVLNFFEKFNKGEANER